MNKITSEKLKALNSNIPQLEAPGAGIPWPQKLMLQYFVKPRVAEKSNVKSNLESFIKVNQKIEFIIQEMIELEKQNPNIDLLNQKILVPSQRGLEDSSRFWSAQMVLEHIVIVGTLIRFVILELNKNNVPKDSRGTGDVKPLGSESREKTLESYRKFVIETTNVLSQANLNWNSELKFKHPWFGKMTLRSWHWLLAQHEWIHCKQLQAILKVLKSI